MPDFSNGPGGDSNSGPVLVPGVYLSQIRIMAPPWNIPMLNCKHKWGGGGEEGARDSDFVIFLFGFSDFELIKIGFSDLFFTSGIGFFFKRESDFGLFKKIHRIFGCWF